MLWTKQKKYTLMRTFALIIAAIPGAVLLPFGIGGLLQLLPKSQLRDLATGGLMIITMATLVPGALAMFALLIANFVTWSRKTEDPKSPIPKTQLTQIILAVVAASLPAAAYLIMMYEAFTECKESCFIFQSPAMLPMAIAYAVIWLALTIIWLKNKQPKNQVTIA